MDQPPKFSLFFLKESPHFEEGTILELEDNVVSAASLDATFGQKFNTIPDGDHDIFGYRLPDRGDGIPGFIAKDDLIPCTPFAENIPPGRCPVKVTYQRVLSDADPLFDDNPNNIGIFGISIDQNLHWQKLVFPLPDKFPEIVSVTLKNTLKDFEVDSYESPSLEHLENGKAYCLHIGHVGPGFYEMDMRLGRGRFLRVRFIKFLPLEFTERYELLKEGTYTKPTFERPSESMPVNLIHSHADDLDLEFPIDMMNHALALATEWGENFRKPIDDRMRLKYPELTTDEIARLKKLADEAESYICHLAERELAGEIGEYDIAPVAKRRFPWIADGQLNRIKGIGMYWARK
ncbi:MAG: hypothetical protein KA810_01815 [Pyrinomonadaceae bacterium]|nr:hypothetical protein [Pyrinomonadaceae bacterium]